jgi:general secretion pathway protein M
MTSAPLLRERWRQLKARERRLILWATGLIALALLWWLALQPALSTLAHAPRELERLRAQHDTMRAMQTEAETLRKQPRLSWVDGERRLQEAVTQTFGATATLRWDGPNATITLQNASVTALTAWLTRVRPETGARIQACHLRRTSPQAWSGDMVLHLPRP